MGVNDKLAPKRAVTNLWMGPGSVVTSVSTTWADLEVPQPMAGWEFSPTISWKTKTRRYHENRDTIGHMTASHTLAITSTIEQALILCLILLTALICCVQAICYGVPTQGLVSVYAWSYVLQ
jgi:hypothetical protein